MTQIDAKEFLPASLALSLGWIFIIGRVTKNGNISSHFTTIWFSDHGEFAEGEYNGVSKTLCLSQKNRYVIP
jgi:hypothetical protein